MPTKLTQLNATELLRHLTELTAQSALRVRPYGRHLLVQMQRDDQLDTVARITELAHGQYGAAFRSHTGRWEPLPGTPTDLKQAAVLLTTLLAPFFESI